MQSPAEINVSGNMSSIFARDSMMFQRRAPANVKKWLTTKRIEKGRERMKGFGTTRK